MPTTISDRLSSVHLRNLKIGDPRRHAHHLAHAKAQPPAVIGPAVAFALGYARIPVKEAAARIGISDSLICRWLKGIGQPNLDALLTLGEPFECGLLLGLGRSCRCATCTDTISFQHARLRA